MTHSASCGRGLGWKRHSVPCTVEGSLPALPLTPHRLHVAAPLSPQRKDSKDVKVQSFSISLFGKQLFDDQTLELTYGHRYGLIAQNGSGKSTLLKCIATRQIPIPAFIDIWYLDKEAEPSERTALESVIDTVRNEKERLEALEEEIMSNVRRPRPPITSPRAAPTAPTALAVVR
jgi:hypothetical protein